MCATLIETVTLGEILLDFKIYISIKRLESGKAEVASVFMDFIAERGKDAHQIITQIKIKLQL